MVNVENDGAETELCLLSIHRQKIQDKDLNLFQNVLDEFSTKKNIVRLFSCSICDELLGDDRICTTMCGHGFHHDCISEWFNRSGSKSCPNCRSNPINTLIKLSPTDNERFKVITTEELDTLHEQLNVGQIDNVNNENKVKDLLSKLITSEDNLKKAVRLLMVVSADYKFNQERSKRILLQKELYEYQARNSVELNKLKSELEKLKLEKANIQSINQDYKQPSTSSKNARRENALPRQIQSPKIKPSPDGLLLNCHFWIVDELRKVLGASNHLYFNEHCIMEHGGTVAYQYTNMVTHVIGISQKNLEIYRGLNDRKKCVTDYWLSDVIGEKKIRKPWLAHHLPIPYSEDNLPYENKQIAIVNFDRHEYQKIKAMVEVTGASVINKISRNTYIVISRKGLG